jgi:hypothetical protein
LFVTPILGFALPLPSLEATALVRAFGREAYFVGCQRDLDATRERRYLRSWGGGHLILGDNRQCGRGFSGAICSIVDERDPQRSAPRAAPCRRAGFLCQEWRRASVLLLGLRLGRFPSVRSRQLSVRVRPTREVVGQIVDPRR